MKHLKVKSAWEGGSWEDGTVVWRPRFITPGFGRIIPLLWVYVFFQSWKGFLPALVIRHVLEI